VLLNVDRNGPLKLSALSATEGINPTMLSRVIAELAQDGFIARTSDLEDRRSAWVEATREGHRLAERTRRERTEAVNAALEGLREVDLRRIEQALPVLEALAEQLGERRP
jgi:DNA-binding MarR family transcriptional regulator